MNFHSTHSLKDFLNDISNLGIQVKNNFEIEFSKDILYSCYLTTITLPNLKQNYTDVFYNGRSIRIPSVYDIDHEINMTFINDASGLLYTKINELVKRDSYERDLNTSRNMVVRCISDDTKNEFFGSVINLIGVRFQNCSGLSFGRSDNDISTFDVTVTCVDFNINGDNII